MSFLCKNKLYYYNIKLFSFTGVELCKSIGFILFVFCIVVIYVSVM